MEKAKIFMNGGSQAVRLPKNCRFEGDEVMVNKVGNVVMLFDKKDANELMQMALEMFTDDFLKGGIEALRD